MSHLQTLLQKATELEKFETKNKNTWCSGCGNFGIHAALKRALVLENIQPHEVLLCFDVGCNGNGSDKINAYTIHGLHGRVLSLASGAALSNSKVEVVAMAGDGATFSEGINHLAHAIRSNYPITFIHHNNSNYGLTIGQASSTTRKGYAMNGSPDGVILNPINTLQFVLSLNPTFVARSFSGNIEHMTSTIQAGLNHPGFSFVEIMQACPTFNHATPQEWYWDKVVYVEDISDYDPTDIWQARKIVDDMEKQLAVGVIYHNPQPSGFSHTLPNRDGYTTTPVEEVKPFDISHLLEEFR